MGVPAARRPDPGRRTAGPSVAVVLFALLMASTSGILSRGVTRRVADPHLVGLGVPLDADELAAAQPVIPGLCGPAARVGPDVEVAPPLPPVRSPRVRTCRCLADVLELAGITRVRTRDTAAGSLTGLHALVADCGRALLADQTTFGESVETERGNDLGAAAVGDAAAPCASPATGPALNP